MNPNENDIKSFEEIEKEISAELKTLEEAVLQDFSKIKGRDSSVHSLHGTIGHNKQKSLDLVHGTWINHEEYIAAWLQGLKDLIASNYPTILKEMFANKGIRKYIFKFLERDFYRHYKVRIRKKPQENLWSIWFGSEVLSWGLLIAPRLAEGEWENKPAEVRKVNFEYWTIGHVLSTGLVDPENNKLVTFNDLEALLTFYESILKRVSNSIYEKHVFDFYCAYLRNSANPNTEPFLIPEFRYEGIKQRHKYRLDFTILNSNTGERIGFELSPQSTHMAIQGITSKTQIELNKDLLDKWNKEMDKRNSYFEQFGITTLTFTDDKLADMNSCNKTIGYYLSKREKEKKTVEQLTSEILALK
ncbi:MAG: hypothetical protein J0M10_08065 [Chitinophagales bacterium]|nr:hypothetical protein [Chitinophagales bacterium]